jgi:hypothetical protein
MIGKKDTLDIFNQYKTILLEQTQENEFNTLINKIRSSSLDPISKSKLIQLILAQKEHGVGDADAAGYASYPEAKPAIDQDDQDTVNDEDRDSSFADEMRKAQEEQQEKYPEQPPYPEENEEDPIIVSIKKDLDAAIAAGDQTKANKLFDELTYWRNKGGKSPKRIPHTGTGKSTHHVAAKDEGWATRKPSWADDFVKGATGSSSVARR